ncbi:hypothetical protein CF123_18075 [Aeromonas veronii]|uniref:CopG family transcriptional regulator n=1 Tax=Aeromonas veronii TaxID=654 RepID=A0AAX2UPB8_AERVE|nr:MULTISPECIES: hypothetical protein [Aeromonas]TND52025.1 hypothetical protein CF123_18075 [Aeromonas veronii]
MSKRVDPQSVPQRTLVSLYVDVALVKQAEAAARQRDKEFSAKMLAKQPPGMVQRVRQFLGLGGKQ